MAMTKKEQAYVKALEDQLRFSRAMRFTTKIDPDVIPPPYNSSETLRKGWSFNVHGLGCGFLPVSLRSQHLGVMKYLQSLHAPL